MKQTAVEQAHPIIKDYWQLYEYSVSQRSHFWSDWFDYANIIHSGSYKQAVDESQPIDAIPRWFCGVTLNFAENVLFARENGDESGTQGTRHKENGKVAVTEVTEGGCGSRDFTWATLRKDTARLASALKARDIGSGDRIFVVGSNSYVTLTLFLAVTWVGAIFSSSSPDMGELGLMQRIKQVDPKVSNPFSV